MSSPSLPQIDQQARIEALKLIPECQCCADCGTTPANWASMNNGVFICIACAGVHRNLGVHISKVKSTSLDIWTNSELEFFEALGGKANANFEANRDDMQWPRPSTATPEAYRREFIEQKYVLRTFMSEVEAPEPKYLIASSAEDSFDDITEGSSISDLPEQKKTAKKKNILRSLLPKRQRQSREYSRSDSATSLGKVEFCGIVQIFLRKGQNLVAKDISGTSDPYVLFAAAPEGSFSVDDAYPGQLVKSSTKKKTLAPQWQPPFGESLSVCVTSLASDVIQIRCMDWDRFTDDDFMGDACVRLSNYAEQLESGSKVSVEVALQQVKKGKLFFDLAFHSLK